jgi:Galactose mutarotase and related enzymes
MTSPPVTDPVVLESATARLEVSPARGGRMTSLVVHGSELLVTEGMGPMMWGCYPMAPFAGRIRDGAFVFDGHGFSLPLTMPPHAIHGTVLDRAWSIRDGTRAESRITIDLGPDWPFAGRVSQHFVLGRGGLKVSMTLEADEPMPATVGWHPWFRRALIGTAAAPVRASAPVQLQFEAERMYERGSDGLPTGRLVAPSRGPWDDCFTGVRTPPRLVWPGRFALSLTSTCDHWVVYDEPDHAICVEPQSGPADSVNLAPRIVLPGAPLTASMTWHWWDLVEGG